MKESGYASKPDHHGLSVVRQCQLAGTGAQQLVLPTGRRDGGELGFDAQDRRAVFGNAVLRQPQAGGRAGGESQAGAAADAADGLGGDLSQAAHDLAGAGHKIYPYLLRNVAITRPDQVWSTDITYVPLRQGFLYLVAVLDWYSRYVLAWRLSNTLSGTFCLEALDEALSAGRPEIFNTDQGSQFTATAFTARLEQAGVAISMDGRGRALDNVFVERLWRSVKYEEVYLKDYGDGWEAEASLARYFRFYCDVRLHQALDYRTPAEVYREGCRSR